MNESERITFTQFQGLVDHVKKTAKQLIVKDKHIDMVAIYVNPDGGQHVTEMTPILQLAQRALETSGKQAYNMVKNSLFTSIRVTARLSGAAGVVLVQEAWVAKLGKDDKEEIKAAEEGKLPQDMEGRREAIMVIWEFKSKRNGESISGKWGQYYKREGESVVLQEEALDDTGENEGRASDLLGSELPPDMIKHITDNMPPFLRNAFNRSCQEGECDGNCGGCNDEDEDENQEESPDERG